MKIEVRELVSINELKQGDLFQFERSKKKYLFYSKRPSKIINNLSCWITPIIVNNEFVVTDKEKIDGLFKKDIFHTCLVYVFSQKEINEHQESVAKALGRTICKKKEAKLVAIKDNFNLPDIVYQDTLIASSSPLKNDKKKIAIKDCYDVIETNNEKEILLLKKEGFFEVTIKNKTFKEFYFRVKNGSEVFSFKELNELKADFDKYEPINHRRFIKIKEIETEKATKEQCLAICFYDLFLVSRKDNLNLSKSNLFEWENDINLIIKDGFKTEINNRTFDDLKKIYVWMRDKDVCEDRPVGYIGRFWEGTRRVYSCMDKIRKQYDSIYANTLNQIYKPKPLPKDVFSDIKKEVKSAETISVIQVMPIEVEEQKFPTRNYLELFDTY